MKKEYYNLIDQIVGNGWEIQIIFKKEEVEGCICHVSWKTKDLAQAIPLPTFKGSNLNNVMEQVYHYFYT